MRHGAENIHQVCKLCEKRKEELRWGLGGFVALVLGEGFSTKFEISVRKPFKLVFLTHI